MWIFFAHQPAVTSPVDGRKDIDKAIGSDKERGSKEGLTFRAATLDWQHWCHIIITIYIYIYYYINIIFEF